MIEIIWGILNIGILVYFIIICFKSSKMIKEKFGMIATIVFVFGLLSFISAPNFGQSKPESFNLNSKNNKIVEENTFLEDVMIEENWLSEIKLAIIYQGNRNEKTPISSYSIRNGFVSGTKWEVESIKLARDESKANYNYYVSGVLKWQILGATLYSQSKDFKGELR